MKKILLDANEVQALQQFEASGMNAVKVIKKIFDLATADLQNIENIDPKGNMGLQALARQEAVAWVRELGGLVFGRSVENSRKPDRIPEGGPAKPPSQWR